MNKFSLPSYVTSIISKKFLCYLDKTQIHAKQLKTNPYTQIPVHFTINWLKGHDFQSLQLIQTKEANCSTRPQPAQLVLLSPLLLLLQDFHSLLLASLSLSSPSAPSPIPRLAYRSYTPPPELAMQAASAFTPRQAQLSTENRMQNAPI